MVFEFITSRLTPKAPSSESILVNGQTLVVQYVRRPSARRYILRLGANGEARVTIPRGGTQKAAREFLGRHTDWLAQQLAKRAQTPSAAAWADGTEIFYRGERVALQVDASERRLVVRFGDQVVKLRYGNTDIRLAVERHLRQLATRELTARTQELAKAHGAIIQRVVVRDQRSRWGSCSARRTISLNWRLIQTPAFVQDYIILHELMHLQEMNHSARFWRLVENVCPNYTEAEKWLKQHGRLLH